MYTISSTDEKTLEAFLVVAEYTDLAGSSLVWVLVLEQKKKKLCRLLSFGDRKKSLKFFPLQKF